RPLALLPRNAHQEIAAARHGTDDLGRNPVALEEPPKEFRPLLLPGLAPRVDADVVVKEANRLPLQPLRGGGQLVGFQGTPGRPGLPPTGDAHRNEAAEEERPSHQTGRAALARRKTSDPIRIARRGPHRDAFAPGTRSLHSIRWVPAGTRTAEKATWAGMSSTGLPSRSTVRWFQ